MKGIFIGNKKIYGAQARLRKAAIRRERRCKAIIRLFSIGTFIAAAPLIDAYVGGRADTSAKMMDKQPMAVHLVPRMDGTESNEKIAKRLESEKITIVVPKPDSEWTKDRIGSMNQAFSEKLGAAEAQKADRIELNEKVGVTDAQKADRIEEAMDNAEEYPEQVQNWFARRRHAFAQMESIFPKALEKEYGARKNSIEFMPPPGVELGIYQDYVKKSIGIACVFFYRERWDEMAGQLVANIDWNMVRSNIDIMISMRDGKGGNMPIGFSQDRRIVRQNLSNGYLAMVAVLADAMEQLTGVERNTLLALMTQETRLDHNNYNRKTKDRGICQLTKNSPLFTYVSYNRPRATARDDLEGVMAAVLPEKESFENASVMMAGLFDAIEVRDDKQGDIAMNMIAGALNYRYNYYMNSRTGQLSFEVGKVPSLVSYHRGAVEDYNGTEFKDRYASSVHRYWLRYRKGAERIASLQRSL